MFNEFYNFSKNPFSETPDLQFFFQSKTQCYVLSRLAGLLDSGQGFALLTGEVGTGKTFLSRTLLNLSEKSSKSALLLHPTLEGVELLESIVEEFGISYEPSSSYKTLLKLFSEGLIQNAQKGFSNVLVIDEAQHMSLKALEQIRLLSNIELESQKLLQILLVGQPELLENLKTHSARPLNQRIGIRLSLTPFTLQETSHYVQHRIEVAGGSNFVRFSTEALELIYNLAHGVPRLINMQCQFILSYSGSKEIRLINAHIVREALLELGLLEQTGFIRRTENLVQA